MNVDDLCASLSVSSESAPNHASNDTERNAEWVRFDFDVRRALRNQELDALAAIDAGIAPVRITVKSVHVASGRSRSQIYASHGELLPLIESAQAAIERLMAQRGEQARIAAAQSSRPALEQEVRQLRVEVKRLEAVNASKQAAEIFALMFTRERESAQTEISNLKAIIDAKDTHLRNLAALNASLSTIKPYPPGAGTIIDA